MPDPIVLVVDDDSSVRRSLKRLIGSTGVEVETFASAEDFLRRDPPDRPSCLVLDVRLPDLSGIDLQEELARAELSMPIIFITGHATVPMSVQAMKAGAVDFIQKPFDEKELLEAIERAIDGDMRARGKRAETMEIQRRLAILTPREHEVFALVVTGMLNKKIAGRLGTSEKTIKVHRGRVMKKMKAVSLADLVRMAENVGVG